MGEAGGSFHALNQGSSSKLFSRTLKLCVKVSHRAYLHFSSFCCVWKEPGLQCRGAEWGTDGDAAALALADCDRNMAPQEALFGNLHTCPEGRRWGQQMQEVRKLFQGCQHGCRCQEEWGERHVTGLQRTLFNTVSTSGDTSQFKIQVQVWNYPPDISASRAGRRQIWILALLVFTASMGEYSCDLLRYLLEITAGVSRPSGDILDMGDHKPAALRSELDAQGGPGTQPVRSGM